MAKRIVLITGGARSGKSRYAEERAASVGTKLVYLATAQAGDEEMACRIAEHQKRRGPNWITVEEPLEIGRALISRKGRTDAVLVDCLTLWVSNLLTRSGETDPQKRADDLLAILPEIDFHLLLVTNEVGWGIVPDNALARRFRDLTGWINQRFAAIADEMVLMVAGNPVVVKKENRNESGRECYYRRR
jgi:adenosylcobinamide kinase/adenosylcobinamide-phosphate guanylyltransferase